MKIYHLHHTQFLPVPLQEAWGFFSSPQNLSKITPAQMGFKILYISGGEKAYAGLIIRYKIRILPWISVQWVTEITHVKEPHYFVDEQRFGPYTLWHHQHHFKEVPLGVEMTDEVTYAIPLGFLGRLAHWFFVSKKVKETFAYRRQVLDNYFKK